VGDRVTHRRKVVRRRGHRGHRRADALSEPLQWGIRRCKLGRLVFIEFLPTVVQHPVYIAAGRPEAR
jgi:hypothetical protein